MQEERSPKLAVPGYPGEGGSILGWGRNICWVGVGVGLADLRLPTTAAP